VLPSFHAKLINIICGRIKTLFFWVEKFLEQGVLILTCRIEILQFEYEALNNSILLEGPEVKELTF
jgi:hypothetical protein